MKRALAVTALSVAAATPLPDCDAVRDCGAMPDNQTNVAPAISACAQRCGSIHFPGGTAYRVGSIDLSNTVNLTLEFGPGSGLYASGNQDDYPLQPALPVQGNVTQWRAVIYGRNVTGLQITGSGIVDGLGWPWWANFTAGACERHP